MFSKNYFFFVHIHIHPLKIYKTEFKGSDFLNILLKTVQVNFSQYFAVVMNKGMDSCYLTLLTP